MATVLTTSYQQIGEAVKFSGDASYYYYMFAKYTKTSATTAKISICFRAYGTGSETCACSGATMHYTLNGTTKTKASGSFSVPRWNYGGDAGTCEFDVTYANDGTWANKSIDGWVTGGNGTYSGGGTIGTCASAAHITGTVSLPAIDPVPTCAISGVSIQSGAYNGNAVSMISTLRVSMNFTYAQSAVLTVTGAGITRTYTIAVTKASSESKTQDIPLTEFASSSDFNLSFSLQATNDTGNATASSSKAVKGYFLPRYATQTYTRRCDSQGNADSQGDYGRLYLKWDVATVDSSNPNTLQTCVVKLNGTVITATSGSIALGYLDFIFPLAVNVQGNLEVVLTDLISSNTITSLVVPKSTMPLSMYQSGDSVGVSIGRMCTESGLWIYEPMHYKDPSSTSIYDIIVEDGYLKASGSSTPLPFLEVREVTATINKAVNSSVAISAPSVTDYDFVGWIGVATYGWIASVYIGNNNASTNVYVAANAGTTTGTGTVRAYALYQRSNS